MSARQTECAVHAGITDAPLYKKTDKSDPMGAQVAVANAIAGQPTERGASPILYAAASPELTGDGPAACPLRSYVHGYCALSA